MLSRKEIGDLVASAMNGLDAKIKQENGNPLPIVVIVKNGNDFAISHNIGDQLPRLIDNLSKKSKQYF